MFFGKLGFKGYCSSAEVIMLFVYMKFRFSLSYRDLEEMSSIRGALIDHSTLQRWVTKFSFLIDKLVRKRKKPTNGSWRVDETYVKIMGEWSYLYRAVDSNGNTVDFLLRKERNKSAARAFLKKSLKSNGRPKKVVIDGSATNKSALEELNKNVPEDQKIVIRQNKYLNNIVEQDHRFIKKRTKPMLGFKSFDSAHKTISGIENIRIIQKGQILGQQKSFNAFSNFCNLIA